MFIIGRPSDLARIVANSWQRTDHPQRWEFRIRNPKQHGANYNRRTTRLWCVCLASSRWETTVQSPWWSSTSIALDTSGERSVYSRTPATRPRTCRMNGSATSSRSPCARRASTCSGTPRTHSNTRWSRRYAITRYRGRRCSVSREPGAIPCAGGTTIQARRTDASH